MASIFSVFRQFDLSRLGAALGGDVTVAPVVAYYIDATAGDDDANDGLSAATPWKTIAKVNASTFEPGNQILFKRGETWREQLTVPSSGTAGSPIVFGAYGTGEKPVISGSSVVTGGWTQEPAGVEQTGDLLSESWESGTTGWTLTQTGGTVATSTEQAASGSNSLKVTGNGTDNRAYATKTASSSAASGETLYYFMRVYIPSGSLKANSDLRPLYFRAGSTAKGYLSLAASVAGGAVTSFDLVLSSVSVGYDVLGESGTNSVSNWALDAWNTIEVAINVHASTGWAAVWINGVKKEGPHTKDTSSLAGTDAVRVGNDAFGTGLQAGASFYIDTIKMSKSVIGAYAQGTDNHRWTCAYSDTPTQIFIGGIRGEQVASAADVTSARKWHVGSNVLTVYDGTAAPPIVEASVRDYAADLQTDYTTIQDIRFDGAALVGVNVGETVGLSLIDIDATNAFTDGVRASTYGMKEDLLISGSTVYGSGACGIVLTGAFKDFVLRDYLIYDCCQLHNSQVGGHAHQEWSAGIKYWGAGVVGTGWLDGFEIGHGVVRDLSPQFDAGPAPHLRGHGIWLDDVISPVQRPVIDRVRVSNAPANGVYLEKTENCDVISCVISDSGTIQYKAGMAVEANNLPIGNSLGNRVINCTIYGGFWCAALNRNDAGTVQNNTFVGNILTNAVEPQALYVGTAATNDGTHSSGNTFTNNVLNNTAGNVIQWGSTGYATVSAWELAVSAATGNVRSDPLFTNAATGDFTLQSGSPCIGAGVSIPGLTTDYAGNPVANPPSIGAFEYVAP